MAYPSKFKALEQEYGKGIAEILVEELNELQDISAVARKFGMRYATIYDKVRECGIQKQPARWSLPEVEHAQ